MTLQLHQKLSQKNPALFFEHRKNFFNGEIKNEFSGTIENQEINELKENKKRGHIGQLVLLTYQQILILIFKFTELLIEIILILTNTIIKIL